MRSGRRRLGAVRKMTAYEPGTSDGMGPLVIAAYPSGHEKLSITRNCGAISHVERDFERLLYIQSKSKSKSTTSSKPYSFAPASCEKPITKLWFDSVVLVGTSLSGV